MKKHPPHLPYKSCSVQLRMIIKNLHTFFWFIVLAVFAGITGALIVSAWIEPVFYQHENLFVLNRNTNNTYGLPTTPDVLLSRRIQNSTLDIYNKTKLVAKDIYSKQAFLGKVIMLSSNGWGVVHNPSFNSSLLKQIIGLDHQGKTHDIKKIIFDSEQNLAFIKFEGQEFRVVSFPDWQILNPGKELWAFENNNWTKVLVSGYDSLEDDIYSATKEHNRLQISPALDNGAILMTDQAQFVGFVENQNMINLAWTVEYHLSSLLEKEKLNNSFSIDWQGYFVDRFGVAWPDQFSLGFYVSYTGLVNKDSVIAGDIITFVEGKKVSRYNFWRQLLSAPEKFSVTVWREGQEFDIIVNK